MDEQFGDKTEFIAFYNSKSKSGQDELKRLLIQPAEWLVYKPFVDKIQRLPTEQEMKELKLL